MGLKIYLKLLSKSHTLNAKIRFINLGFSRLILKYWNTGMEMLSVDLLNNFLKYFFPNGKFLIFSSNSVRLHYFLIFYQISYVIIFLVNLEKTNMSGNRSLKWVCLQNESLDLNLSQYERFLSSHSDSHPPS